MTPRRHLSLGLLFLGALSILSYYTLFKTDFSLFENKQSVVAYTENARGLRMATKQAFHRKRKTPAYGQQVKSWQKTAVCNSS